MLTKINSFPAKFQYIHKAYVTLYGLFILGVNIKYMVFSILYEHINVPMAFKELILVHINLFRNVIAQNYMYRKKICFKDSKITTHQIC